MDGAQLRIGRVAFQQVIKAVCNGADDRFAADADIGAGRRGGVHAAISMG